MKQIDRPTSAQIRQLPRLWKEAFGDSDDFIANFYQNGYVPEQSRCLTLDGEVAAMLCWFAVQCRGWQYAYLYGVATRKAFRGRGYCRELMENTQEYLKGRGVHGTLLKPETPSLRKMYAKMGYRDEAFISEFSCTAGKPVPLREIGPEEFIRCREEVLPAGGCLQEQENVAYLGSFAKFYRGEDFLLTAVAEGDTLRGLELLGQRSAAPGILGALGCREGIFRTPGKDRPFAMFRPLDEGAAAPEYLGFAFD